MRGLKQPKFKYVSICFLDLLERITVLLRVKPDDEVLLQALINAVDEVLKADGSAGEGDKTGLPGWEELLIRVFGKNNFSNLSNSIFYYPVRAQMYEWQYIMMMKIYGKLKQVKNAKDKEMVYEFTDMIHNLPILFKCDYYKFDGMFFWKGFFKRFMKKFKNIFSEQEIKEIRKWCKIPWWKICV